MQFDVLVIGAGPGGYVAAIRAAQLGFSVACVDDFIMNNNYSLGGTCLNVGCIPSKALLQSSENYHELLTQFKDHGISCDNPSIDIEKMLARKTDIINKNSNGIAYLFKKNKITHIKGRASFSKNNPSPNTIANETPLWELEVVNILDQTTNIELIKAKHVILAVGSKPRHLPNVIVDNINIVDNEGALNINSVPNELCIIGAGVIALEMGSVWSRLGARVTLLEAMDNFLASADSQVATELRKNLTKQGLSINTSIKIESITSDTNNPQNKIKVVYIQSGETKTLICDKLMLAVGRIPNTEFLNSKHIGLTIDERGFIVVDHDCKTNLPNIWAVGDCVRGPMLAHKASEEGIIVAERIAGQKPHFDFNTVPWVIYTNPEVAWVGKTEDELQKQNIPYKKGVASFMANGRALGLGHNIGFVKILSALDTDRILGVHMVGPFVSELISEAVVAMEFMASSEDLARIIHAHPSLTEVIHEAALSVDKRAIHA